MSDPRWTIPLDGDTAITADGTYPNSTGLPVIPGTAIIHVEGSTFGSGTLTFSISKGGSAWYALPNAAFTANGTIGVTLGAGQRIKGVMAGSTNPSVRAYLCYVEMGGR